MGEAGNSGTEREGSLMPAMLPRIRITFHGVCEPNPGGPMAYGFTIFRNGAQDVGGGCIPAAENNTCGVAPFVGLYKALERIAEKNPGPARLTIHTCVKSVVSQLGNTGPCGTERLTKARDECRDLLSSLGPWEASWIAKNEHAMIEADQLALNELRRFAERKVKV